MNLKKIKKILLDENQPSFRIKQIEEAVYENFVESWEEVTSLPGKLREKLEKCCPLNIKSEIFESEDGKTVKATIEVKGGFLIETVLMRHKDKKNGKNRNTVCVSSQVGCSLGCDFCATGKMGYKRDLKSFEIVNQVLLFERFLNKEGQKVTNVVFMGMREPLLNYDRVMRAVRILNGKMGIGARKISISTSGIVDGISKLISEPLQVNLAVSLHAPNSQLRSKIMKVNDVYSLDKLMDTVAEYIRKTKRKVMIEYLMLKDVNDSDENAKELAVLLHTKLKKLFMVNLISFNPTGKYLSSSTERISSFKVVLENEGISVIQRYKFGRDVKGACGQLVS